MWKESNENFITFALVVTIIIINIIFFWAHWIRMIVQGDSWSLSKIIISLISRVNETSDLQREQSKIH